MPVSVTNTEYAVRGRLAIRAEQLAKERSVVYCNIGNPQQLGQRPITFLRQLASLVDYPALLDKENRQLAEQLYSKEVLLRAQELLGEIGSLGAYTNSKGVFLVRKKVAEFISSRDNVLCNADCIFLTNGASAGVSYILQCLITENTGILVPVPQYPLYSATITLFGGIIVPYCLDERNGWECCITDEHVTGNVKAIVVINPGNPTGGILSRSKMEDVLGLCFRHNLVLLADEVYQKNVHEGEWVSFRRVLNEMDIRNDVQLVSFHSVSKGVLGECGRRGGYFELHNVDQSVADQIYKLLSVSLCPNVHGQIAVDVLVDPPKYDAKELFEQETNAVAESLKRRAAKLSKAFQGPGISCTTPRGALYCFPKIEIPQKAIEEAARRNIEPDTMYCLELLEQTGICVVPGSGFLQAPGTFHFRTTFCPPEETMDTVIDAFKLFHTNFLKQYA